MGAHYTPKELFDHGFTDLVSVIPPNGALAPTSKLSPKLLGKIPGRRTESGLWAGYHWQQAVHNVDDVRRWQQDGANVGLRTDLYPAVDIDCTDAKLADIVAQVAVAKLGAAPCRIGRAPKRLLLYVTSEPFSRMQLHIQKGETRHLVEILGTGQQAVIHGVHPATQRAYTWDRDMTTVTPQSLTPITREQADAFLTYLEETIDLLGAGVTSRVGDGRTVERAHAPEQAGLRAPSMDILRDAVRVIPNTNALFQARDDYVQMGAAIRGACGEDDEDVEDGFAIFAEWADKWEGNGRSKGNDPEIVRQDWRRFYPPYRVGWDLISAHAKAHGFDTAAIDFDPVEDKPTERVEGAARGTEHWLAAQVTARQKCRLRYLKERGTYLAWDGARWEVDADGFAEYIIRTELTALGNELGRGGATAAEKREAQNRMKAVQTASMVGSISRLLKDDRVVAIRTANLDHDPWTLNTPSGLINLKTGEASPADPDALCTRMTAVVADSSGGCPRWLAFLAEATGGDMDLVAYLQRLMGYALTGSTKEQHLTFIYGPGMNGKSVFLNVLSGILGDYAKTAAMDTFTVSYGEKHSNNIAELAGARLVSASETQAGKRWDESLIKSLTGAEPVTARFLYQREFTFLPQFKLVFVGNHKPEVRDVDAAMRRRIQMVPFTVTPATVDKELGGKLRAEWPAILAWMIAGCLSWQQIGLAPPARVRAETQAYFEEQDAVGRWLEDRCVLDPSAQATTEALFQAWCEWAAAAKEYIGSMKRLGTELAKRGFVHTQGICQDTKLRRRGFLGLRLKDRQDLEVIG